MSCEIIDCSAIADEIIDYSRNELQKLSENGHQAHLAVLTFDNNAASKIYVKNQMNLCSSCSIQYSLIIISENASNEQILEKINKLNNNPAITGIMLQLPVPANIDASLLQSAILATKDVEGVSQENLGALISNSSKQSEKNLCFPCTAAAVIELIEYKNIDVKGKNLVIVGHSTIVGKPLALLLLDRFATVTVCHIETRNLSYHTTSADILISATGKAGLIDASMIKSGAVVIDVGISRVVEKDESGQIVLTKQGKPKMKTVGDVDFQSALEKASMITPVPGGIGPLTLAMLIKNILACLKKQIR